MNHLAFFSLTLIFLSVILVLAILRNRQIKKHLYLQLEEQIQRQNQNLKKSEEKFRSLITNAPVVVIQLSTDFKILEFNGEAEKIYGQSRDQVLGNSYLERFVPKRDKTLIQRRIEQVIKGSSIKGFENEINGAHGKKYLMSWNVNRILDKDSNPQSVICVGLDITEKKEAENRLMNAYQKISIHEENLEKANQQLQTNEKELQSMNLQLQGLFDGLAATGIGIDIIDQDYTIHFQNSVLQEGFGNLEGKTCYHGYMGRDTPCPSCPLSSTIKNQRVETVELEAPNNRFYKHYAAPFSSVDDPVKKVIEVVIDITDIKATQKELVKEKVIIEAIINSLPGIFFMYEDCERLVKWNKNHETIFGYTAKEILHRRPLDWIAPPKSDFVTKSLQAEGAKGELSDEMEIIHKNGTPIPFYITGKLVCLDNRDYLIGIGIDITYLKKAEEELLNTQALMLASVEQSQAGIIIADAPDGTIRIVNSAALGIRGEHTRPLTNIPINQHPANWQCYHPDGKAYQAEDLPLSRAILKGEKSRDVELIIRHSGADDRWVLANASPIIDQNGNISAGVVVFQDITERKKMEMALRESESKYRALFESANAAILVLENGTFIQCNQQALRLYKCSEEQLIGKTPIDFSPARQPNGLDSQEEVQRKIIQALTGESLSFEWQHCRYDRTPFDAEITLSRINFQNRIMILGVVHDITDLKVARKQQQIHEQQLIQADKLSSIGMMVSGIAHEINNPNNLIMLNTDVIKTFWGKIKTNYLRNSREKDELIVGLPQKKALEKFSTLIEGIGKGADRIKRIVQNLKDFARLDSGSINDKVIVSELIESSLIITNNIIKNSTDKFVIKQEENIPPIKGNFQKLEQVIINLITNACQSLENKTKAIEIATAYNPLEECVEIVIRDEGIGIKKEQLHMVMDPFFTTKKKFGGTGLGLSVSYGIIKEHNGKIQFKSEVSQGTEVIIKIPGYKDIPVSTV